MKDIDEEIAALKTQYETELREKISRLRAKKLKEIEKLDLERNRRGYTNARYILAYHLTKRRKLSAKEAAPMIPRGGFPGCMDGRMKHLGWGVPPKSVYQLARGGRRLWDSIRLRRPDLFNKVHIVDFSALDGYDWWKEARKRGLAYQSWRDRHVVYTARPLWKRACEEERTCA